MSASSSSWAHSRLSTLLPLDPDSISQILEYTSTLSKPAAAEHLKNLLGDTPQALEFISSYNSRREDVFAEPTSEAANGISSQPAAKPVDNGQNRKPRRKKPGLQKLPPPRQVEGAGNTQGAYRKQDISEDYMPARPSPTRNAFALSTQPAAVSGPIPNMSAIAAGTISSMKAPPSAQGSLLQDFKNVRMKAASPASSTNPSRTSSPAPSKARSAKVMLQGGKPMHGASTTLSDLDAAIRALEISTNPMLASDKGADDKDRQCDCVAARHPLLTAAPNCLNCGKVICVKQGLGPCTFCGNPILGQEDIQAMIRELRSERGHERQEVNNQGRRKADVSTGGGTRPYQSSSSIKPAVSSSSGPAPRSPSTQQPSSQAQEKLDLAKAHRDKLLTYQAQNTQRTTLHDEAADYDAIPTAGASQWASPVERAKRLKEQQKILREQEWNARPEYEKRRVVVSLDVDAKGKVRSQRKMVGVGREGEGEGRDEGGEVEEGDDTGNEGLGEGRERAGGTFSKNPLMGNLIRPIWRSSTQEGDKGKGKEKDQGEPEVNGTLEGQSRSKKGKWRVVQDDEDDNESWILDGGIQGHATQGADTSEQRRLGVEEHAFG